MTQDRNIIICIPESFHTNISHQLFDCTINNLCEFKALEHKFNRGFCSQKTILNVRFKDFWYIYRFDMKNSINKH